MSTLRKSIDLHRPSAPADPYFYGFRYVERKGLDGKKHVVIEPLNQYDVLHPREGDYISQNGTHNRNCRYLMDLAVARLAGRSDIVALSDCLIDLGLPGVDPIVPDLALLEGVREHRNWSLFSVRDEGARWLLVGELASPSTRDNDHEVKREYYWEAGIPLYFIVDDESGRGEERPFRLLAFTRGRRTWRRLRPNAHGRIWLEPLGVWLGVEGRLVVCYTAEGLPIEDYSGMTQAREEAEAAREEAEAAREEAEAAREEAEAARLAAEDRVRQLEEELRRLREARGRD